MKEIERLIQFAIDNEYKEGTYSVRGTESTFLSITSYDIAIERRDKIQKTEDDCIYIALNYENRDILKIITSKSFIEAVARGEVEKSRFYQGEGSFLDLNKVIDELTVKIAFAIRDDKLPEFINNLLPKE